LARLKSDILVLAVLQERRRRELLLDFKLLNSLGCWKKAIERGLSLQDRRVVNVVNKDDTGSSCITLSSKIFNEKSNDG
jgi:hypothetical protein